MRKKTEGLQELSDERIAVEIECKEEEGEELSDDELDFMDDFIEEFPLSDVADLDADDLEILEDNAKLAIETDFKIELLEGTATMVKMGSEAPPEITPTDADDITGGTGFAPGDEGGPPLGWVPTDGPFVPIGDDVEQSLDAAVVKPGVAYEKTEAKDVMPPQAPPDGVEGAAAAIPDIDGDGSLVQQIL